MLQPRLHDAAGAADGAVQVQVPLVLLRGVRGVRAGRADQHLQLAPELQPAGKYTPDFLQLRFAEFILEKTIPK